MRRVSKEIKIGNIKIGGNNKIAVQSMCNIPTSDFEAVYNQCLKLEKAGCSIVRIAVPTIEDAKVFSYIKNKGNTSALVADIHFDYKIALEAIECGADKIRINPGNIGSEDKIKAVANSCSLHNIPIRVGVNSGSLDKKILTKHGHVTAKALAESALESVKILNKYDFDNIVVAIKSSDVCTMIDANEHLASICDYPIHLGITEAGTYNRGIIKSSIGIGSLLTHGIGDTIRVSLTCDPVEEVYAGHKILQSCGLEENGIDVVSCPTCGRTCVDLIKLTNEFDSRLNEITYKGKLKVAIMGCVVNGPGEAREADIGIAGGKGEFLLFKKGETQYKIPENKAIDTLIEEINKF